MKHGIHGKVERKVEKLLLLVMRENTIMRKVEYK
jgi:hypothetical protein